MPPTLDQVFDDARRLSPADRSQLALALLDSLEGCASDEMQVETACLAEAHRRLEAISNGIMPMAPWAEVKARLLAR